MDTPVDTRAIDAEGTVAMVLNAQHGRDEGRTGDGRERLTLGIVEALKNKGLNQTDIARQYGVTRQHVSWIKRTYGGKLTAREEILQHWPFKVPVKMGNTSPCKRLRDHGEYVATGGNGMFSGSRSQDSERQKHCGINYSIDDGRH